MKKLIFIGLISFFFWLVVQAPVSLLLPHIKDNGFFQVQQHQGSITSAQLKTTGVIDQLSYQLNPWSLLWLDVSVNFTLNKGEDYLKGRVIFNLASQKPELILDQGKLDLSLLEQYIPALSVVEARGQIVLEKIQIVWDSIQAKVPKSLSGKINLSALYLLAEKFGDYQGVLATKKPMIKGVLSSVQTAQTNTKLEFDFNTDEQQLTIAGKVLGKTPNTKAIIEQLGVKNVKHTLQLQ